MRDGGRAGSGSPRMNTGRCSGSLARPGQAMDGSDGSGWGVSTSRCKTWTGRPGEFTRADTSDRSASVKAGSQRNTKAWSPCPTPAVSRSRRYRSARTRPIVRAPHSTSIKDARPARPDHTPSHASRRAKPTPENLSSSRPILMAALASSSLHANLSAPHPKRNLFLAQNRHQARPRMNASAARSSIVNRAWIPCRAESDMGHVSAATLLVPLHRGFDRLPVSWIELG